jgi:hypothetical protein
MWADMLRAFHVGKALTTDGEPSSWMRPLAGGLGPTRAGRRAI